MQAYILYGYLDKVVLLEIVVPYVLNHCTQHTASRFTLHASLQSQHIRFVHASKHSKLQQPTKYGIDFGLFGIPIESHGLVTKMIWTF
jgi:hypothetical protein